jgi:glycosyltransferase involved in cell wall biosynthesis
MRIGIDATPLTGPGGGIARYTRELARALAEQDEVLLLGPGAGRWWSLGLPRELKARAADVFHGTDFAVPYRRVCPSVMTLHDLSPWMDPAWHSAAQRVRRRTPWLLRLRRPTLVITPTEAVRRQAIERFGLPAGFVHAVPHGVSLPYAETSAAGNYFLVLGTLEPRKNLPRAIEAWREVRRTHDVELWLVGRRRDDAPALPDEPGLRWLGEVEDARLPALLQGARAVLYPSLYEGFGLPVLEAMNCGAVVIATTDEAVSEVAGDGALRADPRVTREWVQAMRAVLEQPALAQAMREAGRKRAKIFTWARTAELTRAVYTEAIRLG